MSSIDTQIKEAICNSLGLEVRETLSMEELREILADHINLMIASDLNKLFNLLYRLDISEKKLRRMLEVYTTNAGLTVADLIIERQIQKTQSRQQFKTKDENDIDEDEKW